MPSLVGSECVYETAIHTPWTVAAPSPPSLPGPPGPPFLDFFLFLLAAFPSSAVGASSRRAASSLAAAALLRDDAAVGRGFPFFRARRAFLDGGSGCSRTTSSSGSTCLRFLDEDGAGDASSAGVVTSSVAIVAFSIRLFFGS